ncbi:hypothetical protein ACC680_05045 [Rhizobium ruizarguesonis]
MSWARTQLGELSEAIDYGVTASANFSDGDAKFLRITDIQDNKVDWATVPYCAAPAKKLANAMLRDGDIVFARTGATTGKSFLLKKPPSHAVFASYLRQGAFIAVSGGVGLMNTQQTIGTTVKIVVTALDPSGRPVPSPPSRTYLIGANYATTLDSLVAASASDQPGGLFSVFQAEPTMSIVLDGLKTKRLVFAFNQNNSGTDIQLPIELDVVNTAANGAQVRSDNMIEGYATCVQTLFDK